MSDADHHRSTRADLPPNPEMDEHHRRQRQITFEYLRDKATREERKAVLKEAINEWLTEQYAKVGIWTMRAVLATMVAGLAYFYFWERGWKPPH